MPKRKLPKPSKSTSRRTSQLFDGSAESVAERLLGSLVVRSVNGRRLSGIVVEVEAYLSQDDAASHSAIGLRKRNASMFKPAGHLYVYTIHTRHCMNVVIESQGVGSAVLIRAVEPVEGMEIMGKLRNAKLDDSQSFTATQLRSLTSGPGRLCQAMNVGLELDGIDLNQSEELWFEPPPQTVLEKKWSAARSSRIGISKAVELPLRWFIDGHQMVSGTAAAHSAGRSWKFMP